MVTGFTLQVSGNRRGSQNHQPLTGDKWCAVDVCCRSFVTRATETVGGHISDESRVGNGAKFQ